VTRPPTAATRGRTRWLLVAAAPVAAVACASGGNWDAKVGSAATAPDVTVSTPGTVLNGYAVLASDAGIGAISLLLSSANALSLPPPLGPLAQGDLLLVIQMQGAVIDSSNSAGYGYVIDEGGAGTYELVRAGIVNGNRVGISAGCGGLTRHYRAAGRTQVVRVAHVNDLVVSSGASVVARPWDGARGGVVAIDADGTVTVRGAVDAGGRGFRGGVRDNNSANSAAADQLYRSTDSADGGEKGESIAGFETDYDTVGGGRYCRGAPANGGGGGTSHNGGGGGGANGDSGDGWSGDGVMDMATIGAAAWSLDPAWAYHGGNPTHSSGGGRGGYTFSFSDQDALTVPPGDSRWAGNFRRERGGHGGHPLKNDPAERIFAGGGGGAGDSNNNAGGSGGAGGGVVWMRAAAIGGTGLVTADGAPGENTRPAGNDGPGGGGAGGTIVAVSNSFGGLTFSARGGKGGNQNIATLEAEGPGGGGGGGFIALGGMGAPARIAVGGSNGTTNSASLTEFPANGATLGAAGQPDEVAVAAALPICRGGIPEPAAPAFNVQGSGGCEVGAPARAAGATIAALAALLAPLLRRRRRA